MTAAATAIHAMTSAGPVAGSVPPDDVGVASVEPVGTDEGEPAEGGEDGGGIGLPGVVDGVGTEGATDDDGGVLEGPASVVTGEGTDDVVEEDDGGEVVVDEVDGDVVDGVASVVVVAGAAVVVVGCGPHHSGQLPGWQAVAVRSHAPNETAASATPMSARRRRITRNLRGWGT